MRNKLVQGSSRLAEIRRKKRKAQKKKITVYLVIFFAVLFGLAFASKIPALNIKQVHISGNAIVESEDIKSIVEMNINQKYLWLFPKTNFLLYPKSKIKKEILSNLKRIKSVEISNENMKNLKIVVTEHDGKYLWCGNSIALLEEKAENQKCYFLDNEGYIFDESPYFSGSVYFKFYGATDNSESVIGSTYLNSSWTDVIAFKNYLEKIGLEPTNFWIDENGDGNISLSSEPLKGPRLIFKLNNNLSLAAENLHSALDTEPLRSNFKNRFTSLEYINLSFGNKVYFKFK